MENNNNSKTLEIIHALENSLKKEENIRKNCEKIIDKYLNNPNEYCKILIDILNNYNNNSLFPNALKNASIQLKNVILNYWDKEDFSEKKFVTDNILYLLSQAKDLIELKNYQVIIKKIISSCNGQWDDFFLFIQKFLEQKNPFHYYCGLECFYIYTLKCQVSLGQNEFNDKFDYFYHLIMPAFFEAKEEDETEKQCFIITIKLFTKYLILNPPKKFMDNIENIVEKILDGNSADQKLLKVKHKFLFIFYQNCISNNKKDFSSFYANNGEKISKKCFSFFLKYALKYNFPLDEEMTSFCFQFFILAYTKKDKFIFPLIIENLNNLVISSIIHNSFSENEIYLSPNDFIIHVIGGINENKRYVSEFVQMVSKNSNYITQILNTVCSFFNTSINSNNILFQISCLDILKNIYQLAKRILNCENIYKEIIQKYIHNKINYSNLDNNLNIILCFKSIEFLSLIEKMNFSQKEIQSFLNLLFQGLFLKNNIIINTISALVIPNLLKIDHDMSNYFKGNIKNIICIYLSLIREIEIDALIQNFDTLITLYPEECLRDVNNILKELIVSFKKYINALSEREKDEQTTIDEAASGIIDMIISLLSINHRTGNKEYLNILSQCNEMICFGLTRKCADISIYIYEKILLLVKAFVEYNSNKETSASSILWSYNKQIFKNVVTPNLKGEFTENFGFELFHKVFAITYILLLKTNNYSSEIENLFNYLKAIVLLSQKNNDNVFILYGIKLMILIFEIQIEPNQQLDLLIPYVITFITQVMPTTQHFYMNLLIQLFLSIINYNSEVTVLILQKMNKLEYIVNILINNIEKVNREIEYKRAITGIFSLILIPKNNFPQVLLNYSPSLFNKSWILIEKYCEKFNTSNNDEIESQEMNLDSSNSSEDIKNYENEEESYNEDEDDDYFCDEDDEIFESKDIIEKTVLEKNDLFSLLKKNIFFIKNCLMENFEFLKSILGDNNFEKLIYLISQK